MQIKIEQAKTNEVETVLSVLREAANWLEKKGIPLWRNNELKRELTEQDIENGLFYLVKIGDEIAGCVRYQTEDSEYWGDVPHLNSAFIHRVAVRRKFSGGRVSNAILDWAKEKARREGKTFLRLDCAKREKLCRFYESHGFVFHSEKMREPYLVVRYEFNLQVIIKNKITDKQR